MMRRATVMLTTVLALLALAAGPAAARSHLNAYAIEGQFICVSCHEPLNQVNSPEAQAEKGTLRQLTARGLDVSQVKAAMVDDYTVAVLAVPPARGLNLLVFLLPPLVALVGLAYVLISLPRWRRRGRERAPDLGGDVQTLDPEDARRLEAELSEFDA